MTVAYDDVMTSLGLAPSGGRKVSECGTYGAYLRHKKDRENACEPCLEAKREYDRAWHAANGEKHRARQRRYRARQRLGRVTAANSPDIEGRCQQCLRDFEGCRCGSERP